MQHLIGLCQRGLAMRTSAHLRGHRFVDSAGQRAATAFATEAALAWSDTLGFLRLVRPLTLRRRQAGIVRGFTRLREPRLNIGKPRR